MNQKLYDDSYGSYSDMDCAEDRGDRSPRSKPCPSPVPSDDCFDPCKESSPRWDGRSSRDDHGGGVRKSRSPGSGRKPTRSASEICDECMSMNTAPRRPSTRCHQDNFCDDMPCCPPRNACPDLRLDRNKAPYKRATNDDGGGGGGSRRGSSGPVRGSSSRSPSRGRAASEQSRRSGRTTPTSRNQSRQRSLTSRHDQDGYDDGSLERTTTMTRTGGSCCPDPEERNCESESRF